MKTKSIVHIALLCGIMSIICPISIPIGPVPLSFATLLIYVMGSMYDMKISVTSVILYIVLGCIGLPVFSGFCGGFPQLIGPTGGFIIGFIPLSVCVGLFRNNKITRLMSIIAGTVLLYIIGCAWYIIITDTDVITAVTVTVLPFIVGDIIKIFSALLLTPKFKQIVNKI